MPEIGNKLENADIDLIDETFDVAQSENYHLTIQIEQKRLSFCVFSAVINKYIALRSYPLSNIDLLSVDALGVRDNEIRSIFERDGMLRSKYKSVSHLLVSPRFTLVPENIFDDAEANLFMSFNHGVVDNEHIMQKYLKSAKLYVVFSYPTTLTALLQEYYPNIKLFHHATPFIGAVAANMVSFSAIAIYFYADYLDIMVVKNGKMLFYNTFEINGIDDAVYYLTMVSNMLEINPLSMKLIFLGNDKQKTETLEKYVNRVAECNPTNAVAYSRHISDNYRNAFVNLFNLYKCE